MGNEEEKAIEEIYEALSKMRKNKKKGGKRRRRASKRKGKTVETDVKKAEKSKESPSKRRKTPYTGIKPSEISRHSGGKPKKTEPEAVKLLVSANNIREKKDIPKKKVRAERKKRGKGKPEEKAVSKKKLKKRGGEKVMKKPGKIGMVWRKVDGRSLYLETNVDKLFQIVIKNKKVRISAAAKFFGVPENVVEDWGKILESHKLIDLHYPAIGAPVLKIKKIKEKK